MRKYRLVMLLKSDLSKTDRDKLLSDVEKWVGVKNVKVSTLGEKKLAYPVKQALKAEYVVLSFEDDSVQDELERRISMQDDVLRHLLVRDN